MIFYNNSQKPRYIIRAIIKYPFRSRATKLLFLGMFIIIARTYAQDFEVTQNKSPTLSINNEYCVACIDDSEHFSYIPHRDNQEAEHIAMKLSGELLAPDDLYHRIDFDLALLRYTYPILNSVINRPDYVRNQLMVGFNSDTSRDKYHQLNEYFQVIDIHSWEPIINAHLLTFCDSINADALTIEYEQLPEVDFAEPNHYIGDGDHVIVKPHDKYYHYKFIKGSGDCLSGCLCAEVWEYNVDVDGNIKPTFYFCTCDTCIEPNPNYDSTNSLPASRFQHHTDYYQRTTGNISKLQPIDQDVQTQPQLSD